MSFENLPTSWRTFLEDQVNQEYMQNLKSFLKEEYSSYKIFPSSANVFRALEIDIEDIKVVILGQDPYHTPGVANGLAFATNAGNDIPPSLRNIFKELENDLGQKLSDSKLDQTLLHWANQGVMLLNTTLTVRSGVAASHFGKGWEVLTDKIIKRISEQATHVVFILWGSNARNKSELIDKSKHLVIESAHPSPLSAHRGFLGSKPFSKVNKYRSSKNLSQIEWI